MSLDGKYCFIGYCYNGPGNVTLNLVMNDTFTSDDIYDLHIKLVEEGVL